MEFSKIESKSSNHTKKTVDSGIWFVYVIVCLITMLDFGIIFAFGALFVDMMDTFKSERASTATVQSLLIGISLGFSVVSGTLMSRFGLMTITWTSSILVPLGFIISYFVPNIQYLYATISIISGIGISTIHLISVVFIQQNFPPSLHPICYAIHGVGVNIAGILYPLLIENLLNTYTVHGIYLILGGLFLNNIVIPILLLNNSKFRKAMSEENGKSKHLNKTIKDKKDECEKEKFLMPTPKTNSIKTNNTKHGTDNELKNTCDDTDFKCGNYPSLIDNQFLLLLFASAFSIPALNTFLGLTVDIFMWKGFSISQGQISFVPFNVFSIVSKFIPVLAKKYVKRLSCFVTPLCFCVIGLLSQILVYVTNNYIVMLIAISCVGLSLGGIFPAMLIAGAKIVSKRDWPVASGILMSVIGVVSSALGPIFGLVRDKTGTYKGVVVTIGLLQTAGILLFSVAVMKRKQIFTSQRSSGHLEK